MLFFKFSNPNIRTGLSIFLVFSFYWVSEVIKNVVHVTVSGVIATWYFLSGSQYGMPPNPTSSALKRSLTTSFGSICLGSLIVAILKTLRSIVKSLRGQSDNFLACFIDFCLGCLDSMIRYFNHYAFCQVAIYGKTFIEAAVSTWNLLSDVAIQAIINDNIVSGVLTMGCFLISLVISSIGAAFSYLIFNSSPEIILLVIVFSVAGFFIGFLIMVLASQVVDSGVTCTFVCFAENREVIRNNNPELFARLSDTYGIWMTV